MMMLLQLFKKYIYYNIFQLGFTGEENACKKLRTRSPTVLPGKKDATGFVKKMEDVVTSFWYPECVINSSTELTVADLALLIEECMNETGVSEAAIIAKIKNMKLEVPKQRVHETMLKLKQLKPDITNYAVEIRPYFIETTKTKEEPKKEPKKVTTVKVETKPINNTEKSNTKKYIIAGGVSAVVLIAIAAVLGNGKQ